MSLRFVFSAALFMVLATHVSGQSPEYYRLVQKGEELFQAKQYRESAMAYGRAFATFGGKAASDDRYGAACAWARAGVKDSALRHLEYLATKGNFKDYKHLSEDTSLTALHTDKRWGAICDRVKQNKEQAEAKQDKALVARLDAIADNDQKYRMALDSISEKYGQDSKEAEELWKTIEFQDSLNLVEVLAILEKYGWPGTDMVGEDGTGSVFIVIQHAPLEIQDKYLPMIRDAVKKGNAKGGWLAILEDRVATRHGRKQIYGSQLQGRYVSPMIDPDNVDKRRATMGLGPLAGYLKYFGLTWNVADYKKQLPEMEAALAARNSPEYQKHVQKAGELYIAKQYKESALAYSKAFTCIGGKAAPNDRYNAACLWALAGSEDSALHHLQHLAAHGSFSDYKHLLEDTDLESLHTDKRWEAICKQVKRNEEKATAKLK